MKYIVNKLDFNYHIVFPSDILNKYFRESEANLKRLIEKAKNYVTKTRQSYVLIFDECEALFGKKKDNNNEIIQVENNLKNMMLQYMSGEMSIPGLVIVGITNHIDYLEPAFLRSGRFSHKFYLGSPDAKNRQEIIDYYIKKHKLIVDNCLLENILEKCEDRSRADIRYLIEFINNYLDEKNEKDALEKRSAMVQQNNDADKKQNDNQIFFEKKKNR